MSIQSIISRSFFSAIVLTVAGPALAHQPPALTAAQRAAERAVACEGATARPGAGYRNSFVRFGGRSASTAQVTTARRTAGYRNAFVRFGPRTAVETACTPSSHRRASAHR